MNDENSSGELAMGVDPSAERRSFTSGILITVAISVLKRATTSLGVPAGAMNPFQAIASYPGKPDSAMVGMSGYDVSRLALVTPNTLNLPDLRYGNATGRGG